jgi:hypothetical protein
MKNNYLKCFLMFIGFAFLPLLGNAFDLTKIYKISRAGEAIEIGQSDRYASNKPANLWPYWGGAHQQWRVNTLGVNFDGSLTVKIINRNSGQELAGRNLPCASSPYTCTRPVAVQNSTGFTLTLTPVGNNRYSIAYGSLFLGDDTESSSPGGLAYLASNQSYYWEFTDVSNDQRPVYQLINVLSKQALSVADPDQGAVTQRTNYSLGGQQWSFSDYNNDGFLSIVNRSKGQVLEIGGAGDLTLPGRTANVYDSWGGQNQQWQLQDINTRNPLTPEQVWNGQTSTGTRACYIYNRLSGKVLEIGGNGSELTQEGRQANQWYPHGGYNQQWQVEYVSQNRGTNPTAGTSTASGSALKKTVAATMGTLTLYPNPAHTTLSLALPGQAKVSAVHIMDMRGRTTTARYSGNGQVDVADLAPGVYIVDVTDGQHTYHQKFVKE